MPSSDACTSSADRANGGRYRLLFAVVVLILAGAAAAQDRVRVFQLEHRPAAEIRTLVQPLLPESVSLSATGFKLLARGPEQELQRLETLIRDLDAKAPDIVVETRRSRGQQAEGQGGGASVSDGEARAEVYSNRRESDMDRVQSARGQAGTSIYINRQLQVPVRDRHISIGEDRTGVSEHTRFRSLSSGFYARVALSGDRVRVEIQAADDSLADGGEARRRRLLTTVSGRLGEWMLIGASRRQASDERSGITYRTRDNDRSDERLWLRVRLAE